MDFGESNKHGSHLLGGFTRFVFHLSHGSPISIMIRTGSIHIKNAHRRVIRLSKLGIDKYGTDSFVSLINNGDYDIYVSINPPKKMNWGHALRLSPRNILKFHLIQSKVTIGIKSSYWGKQDTTINYAAG